MPSPRVGGLLEVLGADGGDEVLDLDHVLAELLVDERGVGEAQKRAVGCLWHSAMTSSLRTSGSPPV